MRNRIQSTSFGVALMAVAIIASAGNVTIPHTFVAGAPAKAADVNADFATVATAIDSNAEAIATLQTAVKNIPEGTEGHTGPQGPAGPPGPVGVAGPMGPAGPLG